MVHAHCLSQCGPQGPSFWFQVLLPAAVRPPCCNGVSTRDGGALLLKGSGAALKGGGVGTSPDRFWHGFGKRSSHIHLSHTPMPHSLRDFWEKWSAAQQIRENPPHRPHSHPRKERSQQAQTETQQEHTPKCPLCLIRTDSFTATLDQFYFLAPHLLSYFYFPLLQLACSLLPYVIFTFTSSRSQLLRKFSSCIAW